MLGLQLSFTPFLGPESPVRWVAVVSFYRLENRLREMKVFIEELNPGLSGFSTMFSVLYLSG